MAIQFSPEQLTGLSAAATRQAQGTANAGDIANLNYAKANGWTPSSASPAPAPVAPVQSAPGVTNPSIPVPSAAPAPSSTPTASPVTFNTEAQPGVFKASSLVDFYGNQIQLQKAQYEAAQKQAADASAGLSALKAPNLTQSYSDLYSSKVAPLDTQIMDASKQLNQNKDALRSIEDAVRQQLGGNASEAIVQAEIARQSKPLLIQQQALVDNLNNLQANRERTTTSITDQLGFQKEDYANQADLYEKQQSLAKDVVTSYQNLLEKGATASDKERDNFRTLFNDLLTQAPDALKDITPDEMAQMQTGFLPASVIQRIGTTINQQKAQAQAARSRLVGSAQTGYYTVDANGSPRMIIPPGTSNLSQAQRIKAATDLMNSNPLNYTSLDQALAAVDSAMGGNFTGGNTGSTPSFGNGSLVSSNPNPSKVISTSTGTYDFTNYATDPNWGNSVKTIINNIPTFNNANDITAYIKKVAPKSQLTGDMIMASSTQFGVDPSLLVAMAQHESQFGTLGAGAKTFNPGNVGNVDSGATVNMGSWQAGLNAMAQNVSRRTLGQSQAPSAPQVNALGQTFAQFLAEQESKAGTSFNATRRQQLQDQFNQSAKVAQNQTDVVSAIKMAAQSATSDLTPANRTQTLRDIGTFLSTGNIDQAKSRLLKTAMDGLNADMKTQVVGRNDALKQLDTIQTLINQAQAAGAPTGIMAGNMEDIAAKLGQEKDSRLREISSRIQAALQTYRKSMTGVSFTPQEAAAYAQIFPNATNNTQLNTTLINVLKDRFNNSNDEVYRAQLGAANYDMIFKNTSSGGVDSYLDTALQGVGGGNNVDSYLSSLNIK